MTNANYPDSNRNSGGNGKSFTELVKSNFTLFAEAVYQRRGYEPLTEGQLAICHQLQFGPKRQTISAMRGVGKSELMVIYCIWEYFRREKQDLRIMMVSAGKPKAMVNSRLALKMLQEIDFLRHLAPGPNQLSSGEMWDVAGATQSPSMRSIGLGGQMTGARADLIVFDDVEVVNNSETDVKRAKVVQQCAEAESILMPTDEAKIVFLGTPQSTASLYRTIEKSYPAMIFPAQYPAPEDMGKYEGKLWPDLEAKLLSGEAKPGDATDRRFPLHILAEKKAMGHSNYMLQFMLDTSLSDANRFPLKLADLVNIPLGNECAATYAWSSDRRYELPNVICLGHHGDRLYRPMHVAEDSIPYTETIVAVDPSGRGSDETVAVVMSAANGYIFLRDMKSWRGPGVTGYDDKILKEIIRMGKRYGASTLLSESNMGDGFVSAAFRRLLTEFPGYGARVEETRARVNKGLRIIEALEGVMNSHLLIVDPKVWEYDYSSNQDLPYEKRLEFMLQRQLTWLSPEDKNSLRHDDRLDAVAMGVQWFRDIVEISGRQKLAESKMQERRDMHELFESNPQIATDLLVLGKSFSQAKGLGLGGDTKVYTWTQSR